MKNTKILKKLASLAIAFALVLTLLTFAPVSVSAQGDSYSTISAGYMHSMAIKSDGILWAWGDNQNGALGDGTQTLYDNDNEGNSLGIRENNDKKTPIQIMDDVVQVSAGLYRSMAIKSDGSLWAWGGNGTGQLGDGTTERRLSPVKIMDDVAQVSAGYYCTMAIKTDGTLWAWGWNRYGQLGGDTTEDKLSPVKIMDDVVKVSVGGDHTVAVKNDGTLWAWGWNEYGQLGDGTTENRHTPVKIMDGVVQVSAGRDHTLAIKNDGSLWAWGHNYFGQLGDGTTTEWGQANPTPTKIMDSVVQVSAGLWHTLAIKSDGTLWAWGVNQSGELGDGTIERRLTPVKIMDGVVQVSAGAMHTLTIKNDGSLWAWGWNEYGQLGYGTTTEWGEANPTQTKIMDGMMLAPGELEDIEVPTDSEDEENPIISETIEALNSTLVETSEVGSLIRLPTFADDTTIDIYRSETSGELGQLIAENIDGKTFVDVNVTPGETYHYTVEATLDDGTTVQSDSFEVTVQDDLLGADIPRLKSFILMTIDDPEMSVDGHMQEIDPGRGTVPLIRDGRTLVPIRSIIETMDGTVGWEAEESKITLEAYGHAIDMWLNNRDIMVDSEPQSMDVAPQSINERTMLPVRFVAENIGCQIAWIGTTQEVIIVFAR